MTQAARHSPAHAVGIDLGTTYSCLSYLTPQGEPVTIPNAEGELATPSVVLFDGDTPVIGTEALRNAVSQPDRVVQNSKRFMGDRNKIWVIDNKVYKPVDIAALILKKLLASAEERLGRIRHAVITVPAQFSHLQRQDTAEAGRIAGLKRVDIINEPVAAALCYVLSEGMWFAELADDQTVMVFDLGGGTFDLSLVKYNKQEVKVIASGGDLHLGGIDWNRKLEQFACDEFIKETPVDPRMDKESMQALANDVEQTKRALSVRPKATITVQHAGRRKSFVIDQDHFELLTGDLVHRCEAITLNLLKERRMGWAHVGSVLVTGGATRMPMIRKMLQRISGTTLNSTLSPDQSIAHGAAYYAGMLLSGEEFAKTYLGKEATAKLARFKQVSVNARALGILVRDSTSGERIPHYFLPANTPLPCQFQQTFGTVSANQKRVHLHIVESGTSPEQPYVKLGACVIDDLPDNLPVESPVEVTIRYDEQARVHVSAKDVASGKTANAVIVREENLQYLPAEQARAEDAAIPGGAAAQARAAMIPEQGDMVASPPRVGTPIGAPTFAPPPKPAPKLSQRAKPPSRLEQADRPVPLCNHCGEPLDKKGRCATCDKLTAAKSTRGAATGQKRPAAGPGGDDEVMNLLSKTEKMTRPPGVKPGAKPAAKPPAVPGAAKPGKVQSDVRAGEQEFWRLDG